MSLARDPVTPAGPEPASLARAIQLRLVFNIRDLGGLRTGDGRAVRRGRVFRADGVHRLAGEDLEIVRALGLRTVIDLRTEQEVGRGRFPVEQHPVDWHHVPLMASIWSDDGFVPSASAADFLRDRYLDMVVHGGDSLARTLTLIAERGPVLFHCAAGKDRTGVVAAVLLGLLDVPRDDIAADYHASAEAMVTFADWLAVEFPAARNAMTNQPADYLDAPAEAMYGFLEQVDALYGSMEGLVEQLGVPAHTVTSLRSSLLD